MVGLLDDPNAFGGGGLLGAFIKSPEDAKLLALASALGGASQGFAQAAQGGGSGLAGLGMAGSGAMGGFFNTVGALDRNALLAEEVADRRSQRRARDTQQAARATLLGGLDPRTGITWETGRQGMSPQEQTATMVHAFPEQAAKRMFPDPSDNRPVVLSPGSVALDPITRQPIFSAPFKPERDTALEAKINEITTSLGVDRKTAAEIATGTVRVVIEPTTQQPYLVNLATQTARPIGPDMPRAAPTPSTRAPQAPAVTQSAPEQAEPQPRIRLWGLAERSAGAIPALKEVASGVTGQIGLPVATETIDARQTFRTAQNDFIRALSINPRFPVAEMERLRKETSIEPGVFDSPEALRARMRAVDRYLRGRLENEIRASQDTSLPVETRRAAAQAANDIRNFLDIMGVPQEEGGSRLPATSEDLSKLSDEEILRRLGIR